MSSVCNEGGQQYGMFVLLEGAYYNYDGDDQGKNMMSIMTMMMMMMVTTTTMTMVMMIMVVITVMMIMNLIMMMMMMMMMIMMMVMMMMMMMMTTRIMTTMVMTFVLPTTMIVSLDVNFCKDHRGKIEVPDPLAVEDLISSKMNNKRKLARLITQYSDIFFPIFRKARPPSSGCYRE